ncbi:hypothetical protein AruPA_04915 [Acidiphilium sp. PA]|uniref:hypothetical protein n=1 Tax=Acidiphilium sp. PA TaxID=2871705 RepID=UPI002242F957|nr:hypothetical protein [Acidiphilium sp. PA]MCW8306368.1 hypothetical protein [Acidiphilium sp. PA]
MPWTPSFLPTSLQDRFAYSVRLLRETIAEQGKRLAVSAPLLWMINARIAQLFRRFTVLATTAPRPVRLRKPNPNAKPAAARPAAARPAKPPPNWPAAYFPGPPPILPRSFGWVRRVVPHCNTNSYINQIEHLLSLAETTELVAAHPGTARALRPLCHMLGIRLPDHLKRPQPAKPRPKRIRKPRHRPDRTGKYKFNADGSIDLTPEQFYDQFGAPPPPVPPWHQPFIPSFDVKKMWRKGP